MLRWVYSCSNGRTLWGDVSPPPHPRRLSGGLHPPEPRSQHQLCAPWTTQLNTPPSPLFFHTDTPVLCFHLWYKTSFPTSLQLTLPFLSAPTFPLHPPPTVPSFPELFIRKTWETGLKPCLRHSASCHSYTHTHTHTRRGPHSTRKSPLSDNTAQKSERAERPSKPSHPVESILKWK